MRSSSRCSNCSRVEGVETVSNEDLVRERIAAVLAANPPATTSAADFAGARFDAGLAWVWFKPGDGGLGVERDLQRVVETELAAAGAPEPPPAGLATHMGAPTIAVHGTEAQRKQWLRRIFTAGERWCQLFSEPVAGSDLGGLATRAVRDGDEWVVNGQKVWTSGAVGSRWGMLVARTDPDVPKHNGITWFVIDMEQPGIDVRPLRNMMGTAEFNEVFITDARVPDANRMGEINKGWPVLLATLMNERLVFTGDGGPEVAADLIDLAVGLYKSRGITDPALRADLMKLYVEAKANGLLNLRASLLRADNQPGPDGSLGKFGTTELNKRVTELMVNVMGADAMVLPGAYPLPDAAEDEILRDPRFRFLRARANSIEGGTTQVHKNQVSERVLGLPGEPRVDKGVPWSQVPRN
ncbi:MAG: acyl-CoA dehydrogenase family protein [Acidimicrobiia bacterium]